MDITPYVERLRRELETVAAAAGPDAAAASERMTQALDPALRMTVLEVLSDATAHISALLPSGSVEVRLRGRDPEFVVDIPSPIQDDQLRSTAGPQDAEPDDESDVVRLTLRLPESVKARAEELASKSGRSLNSQMVTMLRNATRDNGATFEFDLGRFHGAPWGGGAHMWGEHGEPGPPGSSGSSGSSGQGKDNRRMQGWI